MSPNRRGLLLLCALVIAIASFFAYLQNRSYEPKVTKHSVPDENETPVVTTEKKIPRFVAGRTALVEKAKKIYQDKPVTDEKEEMPLGSKLVQRPASNHQTLNLPSVNVSFINDLYACPQSECPKSDAIITANGFYIFKGEAPKLLNSKSKALVTFDKEMNQYGIWERRVIIETQSPIDLNDKLLSMKFESIERPQDKLFIAEYVGSVSKLDGVLSELKSISNVKEVRLEITYSRSRGN